MRSAPADASPRLRRLARAAAGAAAGASAEAEPAPAAAAPLERCELCGEPLPAGHRHLLDLERRTLLCACRACALLFDRPAAGGGHYRLVPARVRALDGFRLDEAVWESLRIPVAMAFCFHSSAAGRVVAFYPGPTGATESLLELATWRELVEANPVLATMEPDVEALLVDRRRGAQWLAPVDVCYDLVGLIRRHWKGLSGGETVWAELDRFFGALEARAERVDRPGHAMANAKEAP